MERVDCADLRIPDTDSEKRAGHDLKIPCEILPDGRGRDVDSGDGQLS